MKQKDYRKKLEEMTEPELDATLRNSKEELFHLQFQRGAGHLDDFTKIRQLKKNIARIHTLLSERNRENFLLNEGAISKK